MKLVTVLLLSLGIGTGNFASRPVPMTLYTDASTGVTLRYPAAWIAIRQHDRPSQTTSALFYQNSGDQPPARLVIEFTGQGTICAHTSLAALDFLYGPLEAPNPADCSKVITNLADSQHKADQVILHGIRYTHVELASTGMSHGQNDSLYTTFHKGTCLAFEAEFNTAKISDDGRRYLTDAVESLDPASERHFADREISSLSSAILWKRASSRSLSAAYSLRPSRCRFQPAPAQSRQSRPAGYASGAPCRPRPRSR